MSDIRRKLDDLHRETKGLEALETAFPDIEEVPLRRKTVYASRAANATATECYLSRSCGCCNDAALYLYFFVRFDGAVVYSQPPYVCVGAGNPAYGESWNDRPRDIWDEDWAEAVFRRFGDDGPRLVALARAKYLEAPSTGPSEVGT